MMRRSVFDKAILLAMALVGSVFAPLPASAAVVTQTGNVVDRFGDLVIGYEVIVGASNQTINALGVYDKDANGLTQSHTVGIYELNLAATAWVLLDSTSVDSSSTIIDDGFRYEMLTSDVTMLANRRYRIMAVFFSTGNAFIDTDQAAPAGDAAIAVTAGFSFAGSPEPNIFSLGTTLNNGTNFGGGTPARWVGGNATYFAPEVIPAPAALPAGLGLIGLIAARGRRRNHSR